MKSLRLSIRESIAPCRESKKKTRKFFFYWGGGGSMANLYKMQLCVLICKGYAL